jgi:hypothetical protein
MFPKCALSSFSSWIFFILVLRPDFERHRDQTGPRWVTKIAGGSNRVTALTQGWIEAGKTDCGSATDCMRAGGGPHMAIHSQSSSAGAFEKMAS